jgi:hypothetical protein
MACRTEAENRAVREYLAILDDAAFGAATPFFLAPVDPVWRWTCAQVGQAYYAYSANYLIDRPCVIMDVEASTAIRQTELPRTNG